MKQSSILLVPITSESTEMSMVTSGMATAEVCNGEECQMSTEANCFVEQCFFFVLVQSSRWLWT